MPWAHPHAGSKLAHGSMRLLPERYKVVTTTVDATLGEVGKIYQASGFDYVGVMTRGGRAAISIKGALISEREAYRIAGTRRARALAQMSFDARSKRRPERYFAFRGSRREQRELSAAISHFIKSFPRRAVAGHEVTSRTKSGVFVFSQLRLLPLR
jgi:hypothetical protein